MKKSTAEQVVSLLYTEMNRENLDKMTDDELMFFYANLHHWSELTMKRIDDRKAKGTFKTDR